MESSGGNITIKRARILVLGLVFLLPFSCLKDFPDTFPVGYEWKPLLAFPIGSVEFGLNLGQGFDTLLLQFDSAGFPEWATLTTIPLYGSVLFDFQEVLGEREEVKIVQLRVNAYNGFPVDITIQGYLLNGEGTVIDSLFDPLLKLDPGILSGGGETLSTSVTREDVVFDEQRINLLLDTRKIVFEGEITNVAYFPEFTFEVQLGAILGIVTEI